MSRAFQPSGELITPLPMASEQGLSIALYWKEGEVLPTWHLKVKSPKSGDADMPRPYFFGLILNTPLRTAAATRWKPGTYVTQT